MSPGRSIGTAGAGSSPARPAQPRARRADASHAPGALLWGLLTQARHPSVLALFLLSGLAVAVATAWAAGVGAPPAAAGPLVVPLTLAVLVAWIAAYRHAYDALRRDDGFAPRHLRLALRRLPDLVLLYGTILGLVYASTRLSFWLLSGHYTPRLVAFLAAAVVAVHGVLATPALLLGDAPSLASLAASWRLARGNRLTILGLWTISTVVAIGLWGLLWRLLASHGPAEALVVVGAATGVLLGGFHLALVRLYLDARPSDER